MSGKDKSQIVLAEHPGLGRIHLCGCSAIHVSVGPVTLNLEPEAFMQMAALMEKAADQFASQQEKHETPEMLFEMLDAAASGMTH